MPSGFAHPSWLVMDGVDTRLAGAAGVRSWQRRAKRMNDSDNKCPVRLPPHICTVPHDDDCPVAALTGCLGLFVVGALCLWFLLSILPDQPPTQTSTAEKTENPYPHYPMFSLHWEKCPQCRAPLLNEKGEETGLCEMGFRLLQEDMRHTKAADQKDN